MKIIIAVLLILCLSGCETLKWDQKSDVEKQAWIFSGAIVLAAVALSKQEDSIVISPVQDNCFESSCVP